MVFSLLTLRYIRNKKSSKLLQAKSRSGNTALLLSKETVYHQNYLPV